MTEMIDKLQILGLRRSEAYIYLKLVELSWAYPGELSRETQINRVTVYDILERLVKKGLVTFITQGKKRIYQPIPPQQLLDQIVEKERVAREIIPELQKSYEQQAVKEEVKTLKGKEGVRILLRQALTHEDVYLYDPLAGLSRHMTYDFESFEKRRNQKEHKEHIFSCDEYVSKFKKKKTRLVTVLPDECAVPITRLIFGETVAIISWHELIVSIVIKGKAVADSFKTDLHCLQDHS